MQPKKNQDFEAESDARTIADAEIIKADEQRFKKAQVAAVRMVEEQRIRAEAFAKLAGAKMEYKIPNPKQ